MWWCCSLNCNTTCNTPKIFNQDTIDIVPLYLYTTDPIMVLICPRFLPVCVPVKNSWRGSIRNVAFPAAREPIYLCIVMIIMAGGHGNVLYCTHKYAVINRDR